MVSKAVIAVIAIIVIIIIVIAIGLALWLILRNSSSSTCSGTISNGQACTTASSCSSCNCSNNLCQPTGVTTGTTGSFCSTTSQCNTNLICQNGKCIVGSQQGQPNGSSCGTNSQCTSGFCSTGYCQNKNTPTGGAGSNCGQGAPCNSNLICTSGICSVATNSGKANGESCSVDSDCASTNCSMSYCQNQGTTTGQYAAVCNSNGTPGCGTGIGLKCGSSGTCIIDQSIPITGQACTDVCQPGSVCTDLELGVGNPKYCSALGPEQILIPGVSGYCTSGFTHDKESNGCLANLNQMCVLNQQCTTNNCSSSWQGWTMGTVQGKINNLSWVANIPPTPGAVQKLLTYNLNGVDYLRILVNEGSAPGIYDFQAGTGGQWILKANIQQPNGEIVNFAVSRDGVLHLIVINVPDGSATVPLVPGQQDGATSFYSGSPYVGVFQVDSQTNQMFTNTRQYFDNYPTGYTTASGMVLASYAALQPPPAQPATFSDPQNPPVNAPLTVITDIDIDQNLDVLIQGATNWVASFSSSMSYYYTRTANPQGQLFSTDNIPYQLPASNSYLAQNYRSCVPNAPSPTICQDSLSGIGQDTGCGTATNVQPGFCYLQSSKQFRLIWTPSTWGCQDLQTISDSTDATDVIPSTFWFDENDISNSLLNNIVDQSINVPAVFSNNLQYNGTNQQLAIGKCLGLQRFSVLNSTAESLLPSIASGSPYWILDFDIGCAIVGTYAAQYSNIAMLVAFKSGPRSGQIAVVYLPDWINARADTAWFTLPGYFNDQGRIAVGQNGIYYLGPGKCTNG